jgi:hypothetical protein
MCGSALASGKRKAGDAMCRDAQFQKQIARSLVRLAFSFGTMTEKLRCINRDAHPTSAPPLKGTNP